MSKFSVFGAVLASLVLSVNAKESAPKPEVALSGCVACVEPTSADATAAYLKAIDTVRRAGGGVVRFAPGEYHFRESSATPMQFYISNHDQSDSHPVQLPIVGCTNVTLKGENARFVLHGATIGFAIMDSENVRIEGIALDWNRPFLTEAKVRGFERGGTRVRLNGAREPYAVRGGKFHMLGDGWDTESHYAMAFSGATRALVPRTVDIRWDSDVLEDLGNDELILKHDFSKNGVKAGDFLAMRPLNRPFPAVYVYRAKDTTLVDFIIHTAWGMGVICQRSENFTWLGSGAAGQRTSGVFAPKGSDRFLTLHADATHFSNVKGLVRVENCVFEAMMDDAINVHSTCLQVQERVDAQSIRVKFMHKQAYGFELFAPGEQVRFIRGRTLENGEVRTLKSVRELSPYELVLSFTAELPADCTVGDAVENADYQPAVEFNRNIVSRNRARGALFTTPKQVMCRGNLFERVSGSAILFAGDAQGWYESGACENVMVCDNVFRDCMTSYFQFCDGIISFYPMVKDLAAQKRCYHRDITIENNRFETFDAPILFAISTENLYLRNNVVEYNRRYQSWGKPPLIFNSCRRMHIGKNPGLEPEVNPNPFRAGFSKVDITPPLGTPMSGYYHHRESNGVLDPLHARCLALSDGDRQALVFQVDNLHIGNAVVADIKEEVSRRTGIVPSAIYLAASHIHTGPCTAWSTTINNAEGDEPKVRFANRMLALKCADVASQALADLKPTKILIGRGEAKDISFIRRYRMKDGTNRTNPPFESPDVVGPLGTPDESLQLVRFVRPGAEEIALLNFQCHPDVIGGNKFSSDWPGLACDYLEGAMGGKVRAMLINGAQGDTNHYRQRRRPDGITLEKGYPLAHHMARTVAGAALQTWSVCAEVPAGPIAAATVPVRVGVNKAPASDYPLAEKWVAWHRAGQGNLIPGTGMLKTTHTAWAYRVLETRTWENEREIPVSVITVGTSLAFGGFPGEPFTELGRIVKRGSPFSMTIPSCTTDGSYGYFPTADAFVEGGYENATCRYAKGVGEQLAEGIVNQLRKFYEAAKGE